MASGQENGAALIVLGPPYIKKEQRMAMLNRLEVLAAGLLTATCFGCTSKPSQETAASAPKAAETRTEASRTPDESSTPAESPKKAEAVPHHKDKAAHKKKPQTSPPAAPTTIPKVAMTEEIRSACLVHVGDVMPSAELQGIDGKPHALESLAGEKLTVVCFWAAASPRQRLATVAMLEELTQEVVEPFGNRGVRVAAVNVGDSPANVREDVEKAKAAFPCLLDSKGDLFAKIAKDRRMPRIYLLDADGKILWFDVEYSRPTQESLTQALRVILGER
jgi:peroxiredoxin